MDLRPACEVIPLARAAEQEALRIEPSLPEAHALLGVCAGTDYQWNEAEREWRLAMAHEPVSRDVRFWYGNHYLFGKEYGAPTGLAVFHARCGDLDRAAEWAEQAIAERYPRLVAILGPLLRSSPRWPSLAKLTNLPG